MKGNASGSRAGGLFGAYADRLYGVLASRAHSIFIFAALFCNLATKLFHAQRYGLLAEYPSWILSDVAVLVSLDAALALICHRWPTKGIIRGVLVFAAVVCIWSVMNAGWVIRTGTQILPMDLRPLVGDPLNTSWIVIINLARMPGAAVILLAPSAIAFAFFCSVLAKAAPPPHNHRRFRLRVVASLAVGVVAISSGKAVASLGSTPIVAAGLRFNCQSRAVLAFVLPEYRRIARQDFKNATRDLPRADQRQTKTTPRRVNRSVVIVVLEGIQYDCTSLATGQGGIAPQTGGRVGGLTPHLAALAAQGASFTNARSAVTHTTKALFALLTGRVPSASQDIAETVPVAQPYASLATILSNARGYRTAFFQSAKGTFESRPGLVHNLGFDKFWAREDLNDPNEFIGYLGSDEFAMLGPMADWIGSDDKPFLLVVLCSVTHDPYEVPAWFGPKVKDRPQRYQRTIAYTDRFIAALDEQLTSLHPGEDTIFCVVGDHGEGFGEHRIMGHERLGFEEVLRIALCLRAPLLIEPGTRVAEPVSSMDLTPTILRLVGFDIGPMDFDGVDALQPLPADRQVFFSGWMQEGPAGFIQRDRKYIYDPDRDTVTMYRLKADPLELSGLELPKAEARKISGEIVAWRKATIFRPEPARNRNTRLFGSWLWKENGRVSRIKYAEGK
jgi:arylsulfatase A-like enzyme